MILTEKKFSLFEDWNIDAILFYKEITSKYPVIKLGKIIFPRKERLKAADMPKDRTIVSKIRFLDGCVFFKDRIVKNGMNVSRFGDLLVSNINFEKGAFAVNTWGLVYASTDYTSYVIDTEKVIPEYLFYALRCKCFMEYVASVKPKGMKTRARYDFIKNLKIPVPTLYEQEILLHSYRATIEEAEENVKQGDSFTKGLLADIQSEVSNFKSENRRSDIDSSILQTVLFSSIRRWEVGFILKKDRLDAVRSSFKYKSYSIGELSTESLFGLSIKASLAQKKDMVPMLRMSNIVNGDIDCSELKYLPYKSVGTNKEPDKWLLRKGDFLINRTNSKELVGKSAVFDLDGDYTYASYIIRYRFDASLVIPDYVNILFMLPIVRMQIDTLSRQTAGQCNINSDEINSIRIPVPSIMTQQFIINKYNSAKNGAKSFYEKADELRKKAKSDFENAIFSV